LTPSPTGPFSRPAFPAAAWAPWTAFLAAVFGLPMSEDQLAVYHQHTGLMLIADISRLSRA